MVKSKANQLGNLHQALSLDEQKITLTSDKDHSNFCIDIKDSILNYKFEKNDSMRTAPQLHLWIHNKDVVQLQIKDSVAVFQ